MFVVKLRISPGRIFGPGIRYPGFSLLGKIRVPSTRVPILESNVMSGPEKIRSRGSWSHIVSKATDA